MSRAHRQHRRRDRQSFVAGFAARVRARFPGCPEGEEQRVAVYACARHTGRVGSMSFERGYLDEAVELAVVSHVRHRFTSYEAWLRRGLDREGARDRVRGEVAAVLRAWEARRG
jgi:hypothetical protein